MKRIKNLLWFLLLMMIPWNIYAYSDYIIASGKNIGIRLEMENILVIGTYEIEGVNPAKEAGLEVGDILLTVEGKKISSIEELEQILSSNRKDTIQLGYEREGVSKSTTLTLKNHKTGLYLKDKITGIGTLTFIDPNTKIFGALGHEIVDSYRGELVLSKGGTIFPSSIHSITKSRDGTPGEKNATLETTHTIGTILENTTKGIFGTVNQALAEAELYKVATKEDIQVGPAKIRTVLEGTKIEDYDIQILKVRDTKDHTKNIIFEVTDSKLLEETGGIVQGMSGSPIIQGEYIVGAVTHVVVNDPKRGYGILITNMLEEAEN